jgi:hypothetical protein
VLPRPRALHPHQLIPFDQVLSLSELMQCRCRGYATDEGLDTFWVDDIVYKSVSRIIAFAAGTHTSPPTQIPIVSDEVQEFGDGGDSDDDDVKEFDFEDVIDDSQSQSQSVGQPNSPFKKCGGTTTYPAKKRYCDVIIIL